MKHTEMFVDEETGDIIEVEIDDEKVNAKEDEEGIQKAEG